MLGLQRPGSNLVLVQESMKEKKLHQEKVKVSFTNNAWQKGLPDQVPDHMPQKLLMCVSASGSPQQIIIPKINVSTG